MNSQNQPAFPIHSELSGDTCISPGFTKKEIVTLEFVKVLLAKHSGVLPDVGSYCEEAKYYAEIFFEKGL